MWNKERNAQQKALLSLSRTHRKKAMYQKKRLLRISLISSCSHQSFPSPYPVLTPFAKTPLTKMYAFNHSPTPVKTITVYPFHPIPFSSLPCSYAILTDDYHRISFNFLFCSKVKLVGNFTLYVTTKLPLVSGFLLNGMPKFG
jgi:hypothetical protein